ncbi:hypothetical protein [Dasania marina]|uniref:hypothetical protein n=1 Tax=Dasania marina TaxID=471499 RepID=UPI0030DC3F11|tara:strand:- start:19145 stop:20554 length:1410 start_codon:yes stop_codon:yes gene_type:complete
MPLLLLLNNKTAITDEWARAGMTTEAIIFFADNHVTKEMLYPEFEAVLDRVVGISEFAGQQVPAVYLRIDAQLNVTAAVFFRLGFDGRGNADNSWNIPLQHLADKGARGPDLGAGVIKLSCRSQCAVSWHQRELWDPVTDSKPTTFEKIAALLKRNRLGLTVIEPEPVVQAQQNIPVLSEQFSAGQAAPANDAVRKQLQDDFKQRQAALLDEQKLRIATLKSEAREHVEKLHRHYRSEAAALALKHSEALQALANEKSISRRYKETLEAQAQNLHDEREQFQQNVTAAKNIETQQVAALEQKFAEELRATVDTATAELKEMLEMREVELFYREEQLGSLREEISQLRTERQALLSDGGDKLLSRLAQAGITFVAYQPGLDHLSVPQPDLFAYLESPSGYVAERYGVDQSLYEQWLAHYQLPVCRHKVDDSVCGEPITKVERPADFIPNDSDRCSQHDFATLHADKKEQA